MALFVGGCLKVGLAAGDVVPLSRRSFKVVRGSLGGGEKVALTDRRSVLSLKVARRPCRVCEGRTKVISSI